MSLLKYVGSGVCAYSLKTGEGGVLFALRSVAVELNRLISDLQSFLLVLDRENLSYIAQAKKKSISDLLSKLQDQPTEDAEYMIMNCPSGATNSDLSESQVPDSGKTIVSIHIFPLEFTVPRSDKCYKCAKDLQPLLELSLPGCQVVYKSKHSKKMQHELKVTAGSDSVVMGFQSYEQAEEWRKIIEEVRSSSCSEKETHGSSCLLKSDKHDSCRASGVLHTYSEDERSSAQPTAFSSTEIKHKGFLNVLMNCQWQSLWCHVENDLLQMSRDAVCDESPQYCIHLSGCEVRPGPDTAQGYRITVSQHGTDMAVLEASSAEHKERWFHLLQAGSLIQSESGLLYEPTNTELPAHSTSTHSFSSLKGRRFPAPNMYIDDPFHQLHRASHADPVYSNTDVLEHMEWETKAPV
ncbi:UNVERIFIED_CONTAM: hypothetical protein FKN15_067121 [Acipenser sinensis]